MTKQPPYWFRARRSGFGWGAPIAWQGWVILILFVVLLSVGRFQFPPSTHTFEFIGTAVILGGAMLAVCLVKGEPLR